MDDADWSDVQACQAGDRDAFTRVMLRHRETILRQMRRFTADPDTREELAHDVFVEAWLSINKYRPQAPFLHWLQTLATRVGYRHWKELQKRRKFLPLRDDESLAEPSSRDDPEDWLPEHAAERLGALLERLAPEDRMVLTLTYFESLSANQIAERMGWNAALVRMRAFRARKKLKKWLTGTSINSHFVRNRGMSSGNNVL